MNISPADYDCRFSVGVIRTYRLACYLARAADPRFLHIADDGERGHAFLVRGKALPVQLTRRGTVVDVIALVEENDRPVEPRRLLDA
jgi:hypothetical protein